MGKSGVPDERRSGLVNLLTAADLTKGGGDPWEPL
jgi:hypothetical protein